ncbi:MAG: MFS transporter [Anaerolineae bacterium]|nr:MFS transporter [Anaerolineae bacterium]
MTTTQRETATDRAWRPGLALAMLAANFALLGMTIGTQGVVWAEAMHRLALTSGIFGTAQLVAPLVSISLLLLGGRLAARVGTRRLAVASLIGLGLGSLALGWSASLAGLIGALVLVGIGNGLFEIGMNGAALDWEHAQRRHVLNGLHAGYSAGAVVGGVAAGALLGLGWTYPQVLTLVAGVAGLLALVTLPIRFPPTETVPPIIPSPPSGSSRVQGDEGGTQSDNLGSTVRLLFSRRVLIALALIALLGSVGESVANLWSVILLRERGADAVLGGATFALLNGAMMLGRLFNAPLVARWGARASLTVSGLGLVLTTALLLAPGGLWLAVLGFILLGVAVAGVVPTVLTAGARLAPGQSGALAGAMLAAVYASFVVAPPLIGWLAELFSLQAALVTLGVAGFCVLALVREIKD